MEWVALFELAAILWLVGLWAKAAADDRQDRRDADAARRQDAEFLARLLGGPAAAAALAAVEPAPAPPRALGDEGEWAIERDRRAAAGLEEGDDL
jgi:hypothetical protein